MMTDIAYDVSVASMLSAGQILYLAAISEMRMGIEMIKPLYVAFDEAAKLPSLTKSILQALIVSRNLDVFVIAGRWKVLWIPARPFPQIVAATTSDDTKVGLSRSGARSVKVTKRRKSGLHAVEIKYLSGEEIAAKVERASGMIRLDGDDAIGLAATFPSTVARFYPVQPRPECGILFTVRHDTSSESFRVERKSLSLSDLWFSRAELDALLATDAANGEALRRSESAKERHAASRAAVLAAAFAFLAKRPKDLRGEDDSVDPETVAAYVLDHAYEYWGEGACPGFCVNGPKAGNCHLTRSHNDYAQA